MVNIQKIYINETEAAIRYGYSKQWFQRTRWLGTGPQFIKVNGRKVLYPITLTDEWFSKFGLQTSTSETQQINDGVKNNECI